MGRTSRSISGLWPVRFLMAFLVIGLFGVLTACGGSSNSNSGPPTVTVIVTPSSPNVIVGKTQSFQASVFGSNNTAVTWSVTESGGGTIDNSGNYTAPMTAGTYHIVATSAANPADSGSAPAVVTVPQPAFTSVPTTAAAQDQPYSYTVAATDPAGTNITFALTSAPVGATLTGGNTISWTPSAQQARQNNAFAVTATTAAGGTATQAWAVAPTGTIEGSLFITHWSADGTVGIEANSVQAYSWAALVPQSDGSLTVLPGTGYPDATFNIPNVPAGYYWLQFQPGDAIWTNASSLDYGADAIGHKQLPQTVQVFGCNITGLDPFDPTSQSLQLYSENAQAFAVGVEDQNPGDPAPAPFPAVGSTSCNANPTVGFTGGDFSAIGGIPGIPSADVSTVEQFETTPSGTLSAPFDQSFFMGPAANESVDIEGNYPFPFPTFVVPGALSNSNPQSQDFSITFSAWQNAFNASGPAPAAVPQAFTVLLGAQQQAAALPRPNPFLSGLWPNLAVAAATPASPWPKDASGNNVWPQDGDFGMVTYNNPFSSGAGATFANIYDLYVDAQYSIPLPGSTTPMQPVLEDFVATPNPATGFTSPVPPIGNPQINGTSLFTATTVPTASPTLTWTAPSSDPGLFYNIVICAPVTSADCAPPSRVTSSSTGFIYEFDQYTQTSLTVPAGILTPGTNYVFFIIAELRTGFDPLHPQRFSLPWVQTWTVSNVVTVSSGAAAGVVHGNRSLMEGKAGKAKTLRPGPQVEPFGPTMGGKEQPAFVRARSPFVLSPKQEQSATPSSPPTTQK